LYRAFSTPPRSRGRSFFLDETLLTDVRYLVYQFEVNNPPAAQPAFCGFTQRRWTKCRYERRYCVATRGIAHLWDCSLALSQLIAAHKRNLLTMF
jgi:hypothetical protein